MPPYFKFLTLLAFKVGFMSALLVLSAKMTLDYEVILGTSLKYSDFILDGASRARYRLLNSESEH